MGYWYMKLRLGLVVIEHYEMRVVALHCFQFMLKFSDVF
jgi:hypothetical protein